ncbi:MAG: AAA family ATPase, partial [Holosporales bacterium]|nr:AAA family ATPase [Holosporales bacterium]
MIKNLRINNFRNYFYQNISIPEDYNTIILFGENGSGKTNILEAISLFSQTRGLRSAKYEEMINKSSNDSFWNITIQSEDFVYSSGYIKSGTVWKKVFKVFEKPTRDLSEFLKYNYILWLTYETDRLFLQSPSYRRDFIDMLCSVTIKNHMNSVHNYEKLTKERLKILKTYFASNINKDIEKWLDIIEEKISNIGLTIARSRIKISAEIEESQIAF